MYKGRLKLFTMETIPAPLKKGLVLFKYKVELQHRRLTQFGAFMTSAGRFYCCIPSSSSFRLLTLGTFCFSGW